MAIRQVVIYCRVDGPANESTPALIEKQKRKLLDYAKSKKLLVKKCYEDAGYSGCDMQRPGLSNLIHNFNTENVNAVLVVNQSRLYRGAMPDALQELSGKIISIDIPYER